ncbi:nicotinate-nucleotide--dimethylbenzimidazole phosphoribosyltransferase [Halalkalibacterium ligniniphilum]|uniref:nicotinate-nucleotide--dimethylbenzimidazole phosphoribosyltransferase n=1 Tax=Halalkalibacterium ligniniphilum TaxID=1134413 RepID=UPI000476320E|nr:nicotinate-nucleotide--dimethylbenzimidazole phosphoribosyltransferase [Halalkalibacterium ligniniphilum]
MSQLTSIPSLSLQTGNEVRYYLTTLTKPLGSLGKLEEYAVSLAEMTNETFPTVTPPGVIVFAADHGITAEGVSAYPQEVTAQMVTNFLNGGAAINVFSKQIGALFQIVDIGVASDIEREGLVKKKIRFGTANTLVEDAMTRSEVEEALLIGFTQAEEIIKKGAKCLLLGEMGIGNTTTSSAILAVLSGKDVKELVGQGTGISEERVVHKQKIIEKVIRKRNPDPNDPIDILSKLGGLEIAGMAGAMLSAAHHRIPILVDGFISSTAALIAKAISSKVSDYMFLSHRSVEPGHDTVIQLLEKQPILDLELRLGEGSGSAIAFPILQSATLMLKEMATFTSAGVSTKDQTN